MLGFTPSARASKQGYAACSGCSLCLLVCPVWRGTHDLRLTPHGRAKALQHGATVDDLAPSIKACTLCGACEPVCPEEINLTGMIEELRRESPPSAMVQNLQVRMHAQTTHPLAPRRAGSSVLLAGATLSNRPALLARIGALLGEARRIAIGDDDGSDIAQALETGATVPPQRQERFLAGLRHLKTIVVADGLLLRHLRAWLPRAQIISMGEALSKLAAIRKNLRATDLYVIEPRAYHADYAWLVGYYDRLRAEAGCAFNLDLQRIAIPATVRNLPQRLELAAPADGDQARWILRGRPVSRIVIESEEDRAAFAQVSDLPMVHLAEVADDGSHEKGQP